MKRLLVAWCTTFVGAVFAVPPDSAALTAAMRSGDPEQVRPLLDAGADVNQKLENGTTPLEEAASRGHATLLQLLIDRGANLEQDGLDALTRAVSARRAAAVKTLLEAGVKFDEARGASLLTVAVARGPVPVADMLVARGAKLEQLTASAISAAQSTGRMDMLAWLRARGVKVPEQLPDGRMIDAIWRSDLDAVRALVREKELNWARGCYHAGSIAAAVGNMAVLQEVVNAGQRYTKSYLNFGNALLQRPLWFAAARGDDPMVAWLLDKGAEVEARTFSGQTALMVAADLGHASTVSLLLQRGAKRADEAPGNPGPRRLLNSEAKASFPQGFTLPAVALAPFVIDDGSHHSIAAAANLGAAVEAGALGLHEVRWVERAALERVAGEWSLDAFVGNDRSTALRKGRLARADWMVTGHIAPDEGRGRALRLEVLDTHTAESLAARDVVLRGQLGRPLAFDAKVAAEVVAALRGTLAEAATLVHEGRGRRRAACLFFANASPTDRFDTLAEDAVETFAQASSAAAHVVRFQRSRSVSAESELAAAGWLEQGELGLLRVADAFAWGSITEAGDADAPRDQVQVRVTWEVWTGGAETRKFEAVCRVAEAPESMRQLCVKVLAELPARGELAEKTQRAAIARRLATRARELRDDMDSRNSPASMRRWHHRVALLEAAHFLLPEDAVLEAETIAERWNDRLFAPGVFGERTAMHFRAEWERYRAWTRFADAHGFGPMQQVYDGEGSNHARWPIATVYGHGSLDPMACRYAALTKALIHGVNELGTGAPRDTPPAARQGWNAALLHEFTQRVAKAAAATGGKLDFNLDWYEKGLLTMPDKAVRYRMAEQLLRGFLEPGEISSYRLPDTRSEMLAWAEDAGLSAEALKFLRQIGAEREPFVAKASPQRAAPTGTLEEALEDRTKWLADMLAHSKTIPGWITVPVEVREFPQAYPFGGAVHALAWRDGKLWLATKGSAGSGRAPALAWQHDPVSGAFTQLAGMETEAAHNPVTALLAHDTGLWMAVRDRGILHRDWRTGQVTHHESKGGLPTDRVLCGAAAGGTVFFAGGRFDAGVLFSWDVASRSWRVHQRPDAAKMAMGPPEFLGPMNDEIMVHEFFPNRRLPARFHFFKPATGEWREVSDFILREGLGSSRQLIEGSTMWSTRPEKFQRVDFSSMSHRLVEPRPGAPAVAEFVEVLADGGDFIWAMTINNRFGSWGGLTLTRVYGVEKRDGTVRAAFLLPLLAKPTSAVTAGDALWIGVERSPRDAPCVLRISQKSLREAIAKDGK